MIYDVQEDMWYRIKRGFFGGLKLERVNYINVRKFAGNGEFIFKNGELSVKQIRRPPTPE